MITALLRTVILYFLIMAGLRLMGKRQIGELEPGELVLTMMISDLATVPMQDFGIPLLVGVMPILILLSLSMLLSQVSLRSLRWRALLCGTPVVLIRDGVLCQRAMAENRYTLDELLEELRGSGCASVSEVKYAVLENSGHLSVFPWQRNQPPTAAQWGLEGEDTVSLPVVLINDGRVLDRNLRQCGRDRAWLDRELRRRGLASANQVFLLTLDDQGEILCIPKDAADGTGAGQGQTQASKQTQKTGQTPKQAQGQAQAPTQTKKKTQGRKRTKRKTQGQKHKGKGDGPS